MKNTSLSVTAPLTRTTDAKARVTLPKSFAKATVILEQINETEVRIRKARVVPEEKVQFLEETKVVLSDRDRDIFLAMLDKPAKPNQALRRLLGKKRRHG
jgi:hypothetical protein